MILLCWGVFDWAGFLFRFMLYGGCFRAGWKGVVALMGLAGISCIFHRFYCFSAFYALKLLVALSACSKNALVIDSTKLLRSRNYRVANNTGLQCGAKPHSLIGWA